MTQSTLLSSPAWVTRAFATAAKHFQAGLREEARVLLISILEVHPRHSDSLYLLGSIAALSNDLTLAEELVKQAVAIDGRKSVYWVLLGNIFQNQNRLPESAECYRQAWTIDPGNPDVYYNAANTFERLGANEDAVVCFEKAVALMPSHIQALNNLANQYRQLGRWKDAETLLHRARELDPQSAPILLNLGNVLVAQKRHEEALACFDRAIEFSPGVAAIHINKGNTLRSLGRTAHALECYDAGIAMEPDRGEFWINRAVTLQSLGRQREALDAFEKLLALSPGNAAAHGAALFSMHYDPSTSDDRLLAEHLRWAAAHAAPLRPAQRILANSRDPDRRLRIGYVSPDFRQHPVALFTAPLLELHSPAFEVVCYSDATTPDAWTARVRQRAALWRETAGMSDAELSSKVQSDGIDILIDLSGHTAANRLLAFARRAAPVQVSWLGYFNTTGLEEMDYLVVDRVICHPGERPPYVEKPLILDGCYLAYRGPEYAPDPAPLPMLKNGFPTYGCFNSISKLTPDVIALWARLLHDDRNARLLLKNGSFADPETRRSILAMFAGHGVDEGRVVASGPAAHAAMLDSYRQIDVALDPFPYNGGTTTCEALWMGVPVVSIEGGRFVSRVGATILHNAGCSDWVVGDAETYIRKALELTSNPAHLANLRAGLRDRVRGSMLGNVDGFARRWEDALRGVWRQWCAQSQ